MSLELSDSDLATTTTTTAAVAGTPTTALSATSLTPLTSPGSTNTAKQHHHAAYLSRYRWCLVSCYHYSFACVGMILAAPGPTLLALQRQAHCTLSQISGVFSMAALGFAVGSVLLALTMSSSSSSSFFKQLRQNPRKQHLVYATGMTLASVCTVLVITSKSIGAFYAVFFGIGFFLAVVALYRDEDTSTSTGSTSLASEVQMKLMHFCSAVGGFLSPLAIEVAVSLSAAHSYRAALVAFALATVPVVLALVWLPSPPPSLLEVSVSKAAGDYASTKKSRQFEVSKKAEDFKKERKNNARKWVLLGLASLVLASVVGLHMSYHGYISTFAATIMSTGSQRARERTGRMLTSTYWAFFGCGRLLSGLLTRLLPPLSVQLSSHLVATVLASLIACFLSDSSIEMMYACSALMGVGVSAVYPSLFVWMEEKVGVQVGGGGGGVTTSMTSLLVFGGSVGAMTLPYACGVLMDVQGVELFPLVLLVYSLGCLLLFVTVFWLARSECLRLE